MNDQIIEWLINAGVSPGQMNSMWFEYWDTLAVADGAFNDRMYTWLGSIGYTGALPDRLTAWLNSSFAGATWLDGMWVDDVGGIWIDNESKTWATPQ